MFRQLLTLPNIAAISLLCCVSGCKKPTAAPPPKPPLVQVAKPLQRDVPIIAEVIAQTEATANVEVRARVEATVEKIAFVEGSTVKEGDLLFVLDKKPIEQRLAAAKGDLGQLQATLDRTKQDAERLLPLAARKAVSQMDLDNARSAQKQAEAALESGLAKVKSAELDLGYADVTAPVSGIIGAKQVDVGTLVGKGQPTVLATISPLDPIWANLELSEVTYLNNAEKINEQGNQPVFSLILANGKTHPQTGRLAFVDRMVNATTGTLKLRVEFPNPQRIIRPGQFCRVRVLTKTAPGALLIPQRAVQELQGLHNVFVVGADNKVSFKRVQLGRRIGPLWLVESGLSADDTIIVEGLLKARDGAPVEPQPFVVDDTPLKELAATLPGAPSVVPAVPASSPASK